MGEAFFASLETRKINTCRLSINQLPNFHDSHRFGLTQNSPNLAKLTLAASVRTLGFNTTCRAHARPPARFSSDVELLLPPPVSLAVPASFAFSRLTCWILVERGDRSIKTCN